MLLVALFNLRLRHLICVFRGDLYTARQITISVLQGLTAISDLNRIEVLCSISHGLSTRSIVVIFLNLALANLHRIEGSHRL
jgi:hypothetical protein